MTIKAKLNETQYGIERAICDKAEGYRKRITLGKRNYLTTEEINHPLYKACNNEMRGRVEQYEILRDLPETIVAYIDDNYAATTWTGLKLSHDGICTGEWSINSYSKLTMEQYRYEIGNREYTGRGMGKGMVIILRETANSKRQNPRGK